MTPHVQALATVLERIHALPTERLPLEQAAGRVIAAGFRAPFSLPGADDSQMDGYAVRALDLAGASEVNPIALAVTQRIFAGGAPGLPLEPGQAARIMTGASLPPGADAVVMQEDVEAMGDRARFHRPVEPGVFIRRMGSDLREGALALAEGSVLGASELALLAALGRTHVHVHRRPRVAILSTGDELVELGQPIGPGKRVDSNALALGIRLAQLGAEPVQLGIARDDRQALLARFRAASGCEGIISSAGVSVGERDHVKDVLRELGAELHLEKVAIRPGKPLVFATTPSQFFFGLPGNPVSSRVTFEVFVRPALRALLGHRLPEPTLPALLEADLRKVEALTFFTRVELVREGDRLLARARTQQGSGALTSLVGAQGLAILPAGVEVVRAGTVVEVIAL